MVLQGIRANIAKKPYIFVIFQGVGGSGPPVLPLDPHMSVHNGEQRYYAVFTQTAKTLIRLDTRISSNRLNVHVKMVMK